MESYTHGLSSNLIWANMGPQASTSSKFRSVWLSLHSSSAGFPSLSLLSSFPWLAPYQVLYSWAACNWNWIVGCTFDVTQPFPAVGTSTLVPSLGLLVIEFLINLSDLLSVTGGMVN